MKWCRYIVLVLGLLCFCQQLSYAQDPRNPFLYLRHNTLYMEGVKVDKAQESILFSDLGEDDLYDNWKKANKKIVAGRTLNVLSIVTAVSGFAVISVVPLVLPFEIIGYQDASTSAELLTAGVLVIGAGAVFKVVGFSCKNKGFSEKYRIINEINMGQTRNGVGLTFTF